MNKFTILLLLVLCFQSCKLFKKKTVITKDKGKTEKPVAKLLFTELPWNEVKNALALDYTVKSKGSEGSFNVFPYSEKGYEFDYLISGKPGYIKMTDSAIKYAIKYENYFGGDSSILNHSTAVWLSQLNYSEIQLTGKTRMNLGSYGMVDFKLDTLKTDSVWVDGKPVIVPVARIISPDRPFSISFLRDKNYPLIVRQTIGFKIRLNDVQLKEPEYYKYEIGPGCVLDYRFTENGAAEYYYTLTNTSWTDTAVVFNVKGSYSGSYEYDYDYNISLTEEALSNPRFAVLFISAVSSNKIIKMNKYNQAWLKKPGIDRIESKGKGFLDVPHFFYNPDDFDTTQISREDLIRDRKRFAESDSTFFVLNRNGKLIHTGYTVWDENDDAQVMATLSMRNKEYETDLQVSNAGKYPLVVLYDDNRSSRIELRKVRFVTKK